MQIPAKYYERIPQFYFIVGVLLLVNAIYLGREDFAAYFYFAFGMVSLLYAAGVQKARAKYRKEAPEENDQQSES